MTVFATSTPQVLALKDSIEKIKIRVFDEEGEPVVVDNVSLKVYDVSGDLLFQDDFTDGFGDPAALPTSIENPTDGTYYFPFGDTAIDDANDTSTLGEFLFIWDVTSGTSESRELQLVKVVSASSLMLIPKLQLVIDKARKAVDDDASDPCFLGYTDWMLMQYLSDGLGYINSVQPYPIWSSVDDFPTAHWSVLRDAAVIAALTSQELFAVDTDLNYSDQGNVFVIDHQPKLSAILNATWARFMQVVPQMKKMYVQSGSVRVEAGPNFRLATIIASAPPGSAFRNLFISGA